MRKPRCRGLYIEFSDLNIKNMNFSDFSWFSVKNRFFRVFRVFFDFFLFGNENFDLDIREFSGKNACFFHFWKNRFFGEKHDFSCFSCFSWFFWFFLFKLKILVDQCPAGKAFLCETFKNIENLIFHEKLDFSDFSDFSCFSCFFRFFHVFRVFVKNDRTWNFC